MQPIILRVKRKRNADAPEDLVVERLGAAAKRPHTSLASQLDSMSLAGSGAAAGQAPAAATDNAHNLSRFSRLTTLSAAEISSLSQMQLAMLLEAQRLRQQQEQHEVQRQQELAAQTDAEGQAAAAPAAGAAVGAPAVAATAAGPGAAAAGARYEQIRQPARRRGLSLFQATESGPDPLAGFATIYEVVRHEQQVAREQAGSGKRHRGRVHDGQPPSWQAFPEGTLMCNDQPAVREPAAAAAALGVDGAAQMDVASEEAQDEGHGGGEDGDQEDDYVYDLYCPAVEEGEGADRWMELHASGRAPVIQILDDDSWLVVEGSDVDDSDADTEDSNAEGYYAHDYPDERSEYSSDDDGGYDPEGAGRRRRGRDWWGGVDEERGGSDDSEGRDPWGHPRPYW